MSLEVYVNAIYMMTICTVAKGTIVAIATQANASKALLGILGSQIAIELSRAFYDTLQTFSQ